MLVSTKQLQMVPLSKRVTEDPTATAAAGLQGGLHGAMLQSLQNGVQTQTAETTAKVQQSATGIATQQVNEAKRISDNVDEAFAKTRVGLQTADAAGTTGTSATEAFKEYMSKTPEQRLRDSILDEMGITQEEIDAMPPEKQLAIGEEIAQRMQDKMQLAQADKEESGNSVNKDNEALADKFLASL